MATKYLTCSCCGKVVDLDHFDIQKPLTKQMVQDGVCFECRFWNNYIANPIPDTCIVSGYLMYFKPIRGKIHGRKIRKPYTMFAQDMKTGEMVVNFERKTLGMVPECFRDQLPDRFKVVDRQTYKRIKEREEKHCMMKGCFDRYNCIWYDPKIAEPDGPWNALPSQYKPGMEECESFINKNTMYNV